MTSRFAKILGDHISQNPDETRALARSLASELRIGDLVALQGDLGAGKTVFAQGLGEGLHVSPEVPVRSPTFAIFNIHQGPKPMVHADLYRIDDPEEIEALGLIDLLEGSVMVIEWAEKGGVFLARPNMIVSLKDHPEDISTRRIRIEVPND